MLCAASVVRLMPLVVGFVVGLGVGFVLGVVGTVIGSLVGGTSIVGVGGVVGGSIPVNAKMVMPIIRATIMIAAATIGFLFITSNFLKMCL